MVIKVMVADDQALIRESLKIILSAHPDIEVVATVEDGNHVLSSIPQTHPDMINPNIASKVFQIFSQMAKTNFSIAVDEDNVKDLSTTEWRIIQEVGYGESNKEIAAKLFLSEGTVRNYLSTILAKLNLRDRTQLAIWSVQTGVTRRDFSKGNTE